MQSRRLAVELKDLLSADKHPPKLVSVIFNDKEKADSFHTYVQSGHVEILDGKYRDPTKLHQQS